ncbi:MAG: hypothetical protein ABGX16_17825 [Pirellulales bacterium]
MYTLSPIQSRGESLHLSATIPACPFDTGQTFLTDQTVYWETLPAIGFLRRSPFINFSGGVALQPLGAFYRVELCDRLVNPTSNLAV